MMISKTCLYALRATAFIARSDEAGYVTIQQISEKLEISFTFLTKILQQLSNAGILQSRKGPGGGVKLAKKESEISFLDVVNAVDDRCTQTVVRKKTPECARQCNCALYEHLSSIQNRVAGMMDEITLADITIQPQTASRKQQNTAVL
jgi:Rrf2 family transcriptional regulator, iron-sulfur cluster assembly transcription factor